MVITSKLSILPSTASAGSSRALRLKGFLKTLRLAPPGWAWLINDGGTLSLMKTSNADLPLAHGKQALLTCDVWEHAYYIDYRNARAAYVDAFLDHLVNWEFVASNM